MDNEVNCEWSIIYYHVQVLTPREGEGKKKKKAVQANQNKSTSFGYWETTQKQENNRNMIVNDDNVKI